ncbi:hypothetical protein [Haloarcula montana]|uniref:hypothetical protein n=1 Tax=Haloarcula montana TaxID=3111776 RepID=UPI002D7929AF|nr:hypothetical protein [Haloarcula sp. GH36]
MTGFANLLKTMALLHLLPFGFIVANVYTSLPVGVKAYLLGQLVATGVVLDMIFSSVTSVALAIRAYLALFQEAIFLVVVGICGIVFWVRDEIGSNPDRHARSDSWIDRLRGDSTDSGRGTTSPNPGRSARVRGETIVVLFLCSLVLARLVAVVFPPIPSSGASLLSAPEVAVYQSELFHDDYEFVVQLLKVVRLDLYLVIGLITLLAMFPLGRDIGPRQMKYSYLVTGAGAQIVILPAVVLSVFGLTIFGVTVIPPNAPVELTGNFTVLAAPIFLLLLVVGAVTREFLRKAEHTYGS